MRSDLRAKIRRLLRAREGTTAVEYAIIAAGVAGAIIVAVGTVGSKVNAMWTAVAGIFS
jgi:pilus assembly protein Flp/PilA